MSCYAYYGKFHWKYIMSDHWCRLLWGIGARAPSLDFQLFNFYGQFKAAPTMALDSL